MCSSQFICSFVLILCGLKFSFSPLSLMSVFFYGLKILKYSPKTIGFLLLLVKSQLFQILLLDSELCHKVVSYHQTGSPVEIEM